MTHPRIRPVRALASAALVAVLLTITAACSNGDSSDENRGATPESVVAEAKATVDSYLKPATDIGVSTPLESRPEAGKTVYWLVSSLEDQLDLSKGFKEATDALGWKLVSLTYDTADPQQANSVMQQAVDAKADYIAIAGIAQESFASALENAKKANIPVFDMVTPNVAQGTENGLYMVTGGVDLVVRYAQILTDYVIADSNGTGKIAFFNLPDFPILAAEEEAYKEAVKKCPGCTLDPVPLTIQNLTQGEIAQLVTSYAQSNPDVKYFAFAIGAMATGVRDALKTAQVGSDVKIFGANPTLAQVQALIDGTESAWLTMPREGMTWNVVDAMARNSLGMSLDEASSADLPTELWTPENVPSPAADYTGVQGYQELWKKLWLVG